MRALIWQVRSELAKNGHGEYILGKVRINAYETDRRRNAHEE